MLKRALGPVLIVVGLTGLGCGDDEGDGNDADGAMDGAQLDGGVDSSFDAQTPDANAQDASADADDSATPEPCAVVAKYDDNNDGNYERFVKTIEWVEGYKHIAIYDTDNDADGTYDQREYSVRRDTGTPSLGGRLEQYFVDLATGDRRVRITMEYDSEGRPSRQAFDTDFDGTPSGVSTWTYHDNGELAESTSYSDVDQDGTFDGFNRRINDEQGRLIRSESDMTTTPDPNGDAVDSWEIWEYEGVTTKHSEFDLDGLIRYDENDYDDMGRWLRQAESPNGDTDFADTVDTVTTFTWDGNVRTGRSDGNGNTAPDGEWEYESVVTFDDDGWNIESKSRLRDGEFKDHNKRTYDADHNLLKEEWDEDGDGTFEAYDTYTYSDYGDETSFESYRGGEVMEARYATYAYDAKGNMTLCEADRDGDDEVEDSQSWVYDGQTRLTKYTRDDRTDDSGDLYVVDYEYLCPAEFEL